MKNKHENFIKDLVFIHLDSINKIKRELIEASANDKDYIKGKLMAYYEVLTIIKSQAELFDIDVHALSNINLETYLYTD